MKFGSLKEGGLDGTLVLVSKDLTCATKVYIKTFQELIETWSQDYNWSKISKISEELNKGILSDTFEFNPEDMASPLPRAYQFLDGSAYHNHIELARKARGLKSPYLYASHKIPLMYQGVSDQFLGPTDPIIIDDENYGLDFEAELAIIVDYVPQGIDSKEARKHIMCLMILNDITLRNLLQSELTQGFGFIHGKPPSSFSPVAVTLEDIPSAYGEINNPLISSINDVRIGRPKSGVDMTFNFGELISHAAKTRNLSAGTIIGSGTVSNYDNSVGVSCILENRAKEIISTGQAFTPYLKDNDKVTIEMFNYKSESIFGAINQKVIIKQK